MSSVGLLRRNARLRKEYLYRKSLEGKEKELYEKKRKIRQALEGMHDTHYGLFFFSLMFLSEEIKSLVNSHDTYIHIYRG